MAATSEHHKQQNLLEKLLLERDSIGEAMMQLEALLEDRPTRNQGPKATAKKITSRQKSSELSVAKRSALSAKSNKRRFRQ